MKLSKFMKETEIAHIMKVLGTVEEERWENIQPLVNFQDELGEAYSPLRLGGPHVCDKLNLHVEHILLPSRDSTFESSKGLLWRGTLDEFSYILMQVVFWFSDSGCNMHN